MLVLSRKHRESVVIGAGDLAGMLRVTVLAIRNGTVRLGFEGDQDVAVHREEVWERMHTSRPRDPPTCGRVAKEPANTDGRMGVLSGTGRRTASLRQTNRKGSMRRDSGADCEPQCAARSSGEATESV